MGERFQALLPSILIVASVAGAAKIYLWFITKRFARELNSVSWVRAHPMKGYLFVGLPLASIFAPTCEELAFRLPLIIGFEDVTKAGALIAIFISSLLFGLTHYANAAKLYISSQVFNWDPGDIETDDIKVEVDRRMRRLSTAQRIGIGVSRMIVATSIGLALGYYAIVSQSLWRCVGLHSVWNLVIPIVIQILVTVVILFFTIFYRVIFGRDVS